MIKNRYSAPERPWFIALALAGLVAAAFFIASFLRTTENPFIFCSSSDYPIAATRSSKSSPPAVDQIRLEAILHYATSQIVPQQSQAEIRISYDVVTSLGGRPFNFLVFGLGFDSIMWNSFNPTGTTLFLEEDPKWVQTVLKDAPYLRAHTVNYRTQLQEADELLRSYKSEPLCWPCKAYLKGNKRCKLALHNLPDEVYEREWDLIMVDAPKGYFAEAPGRMAAIFSAAVMARNRKGPGVTHVFLHDVNRKVEKVFAEEFLCRKNLVNGVGRLWHFKIAPAVNDTRAQGGFRFC